MGPPNKWNSLTLTAEIDKKRTRSSETLNVFFSKSNNKKHNYFGLIAKKPSKKEPKTKITI